MQIFPINHDIETKEKKNYSVYLYSSIGSSIHESIEINKKRNK